MNLAGGAREFVSGTVNWDGLFGDLQGRAINLKGE